MGRLIDADLLIERIRKNDVLPWDLDKHSQIVFEYCITAQPTVEIPFAYVANKWIPCSEKLPDKNDSYLVTICNYDETASINYRSIDHGNSDGSFLHCGTKKPRTKRGEYIVAWMPLPEPYRPKEDK